jgi:hypothetical protein
MVNLELNQEYIETRKKLSKRVNRLGFWAAILTAILAAAFITMGMFGSTSWDTFPGMVNYIWSYIKVIDYALFIPGFLLSLVFVVLMACIHYYASLDKKIYSLIGLAFAVIYAAVITTDYFTLWTVILPSTIRGETAGLSIFSMYNPHGLFVALESVAYLMMSVALLSIAPVFEGGKIEKVLRWIFIIGFILTIGSLFAVLLMNYDIVMFEIAIIAIYCPLLVIAGVLLAIIFRRNGKTNSGEIS